MFLSPCKVYVKSLSGPWGAVPPLSAKPMVAYRHGALPGGLGEMQRYQATPTAVAMTTSHTEAVLKSAMESERTVRRVESSRVELRQVEQVPCNGKMPYYSPGP